MEKSDSSFITIKSSLLIFIFAVMITAAVFTSAYLPYREHTMLEVRCVKTTTAEVCEDGKQTQDGMYYYGPSVIYNCYEASKNVKTDAVNTVNLNRQWKNGEQLTISYNPDNPSEVILNDDRSAERHFYMSIIICSAFTAFSIVLIIIAVARSLKKPPERVSVANNILGQSFEEWQKSVQAQKEKEAEAENSESQEEISSPEDN